MQKLLLPILLVFMALEGGCDNEHITVPITEACTVSGMLAAGAFCKETRINGNSRDLTLDQFLDFLEPQLERPDPEHPGAVLPARAGAICQSATHWNLQKTALEQACRVLGRDCTYEMQQTIKAMDELNQYQLKMMGLL